VNAAVDLLDEDLPVRDRIDPVGGYPEAEADGVDVLVGAERQRPVGDRMS